MDYLLSIQQRVTGRLPVVFPLAMQDITPYGNDVHHLNSILQTGACVAVAGYNAEEFDRLVSLYGSMAALQTQGR